MTASRVRLYERGPCTDDMLAREWAEETGRKVVSSVAIYNPITDCCEWTLVVEKEYDDGSRH